MSAPPPGRAAGPRLLACALAAGAFTLYALPSIGNGFVYDDHEVIFGAPAPRSLAELAAVFGEPHFRGLPYYRPVVRASLLGQRMLHGGSDPAPFHLANAALAAAAAVLAFALLRLPAFGVSPVPAALAAAIFITHPVASSVVFPAASGRETLLPAVFALLATWAFLRGGRAGHVVSVLAFAAALLGKEASIVLPALFVLADAIGLSAEPPGRVPRRWVSRYAPFACVVAAYVAIRAVLFSGSELRLALFEDPLGPLRSIAFALQTSILPRGELAYEPELSLWWSPARLLAATAACAVLAATTWRAGAHVHRRAAWWAAWFGLSLLPTANILRQEAPFDERYVFLGWLALPTVAALSLGARWSEPFVRRGTLLIALPVLLALGVITVSRAVSFRDDARFAAQWLRTNPASPEAHHLQGLLALRDGRWDDAVPSLREAARLAPDSPEIRHNLGAALLGAGKVVGARVELEVVLRLAPEHPEANNALGLIAARDGRLDEAEIFYRTSVRVAPTFVEARNNLATVLARRGDIEGAEAELRRALALAPDYDDAKRNLAHLLSSKTHDPRVRPLDRQASVRDDAAADPVTRR